MNRRGEHRVTLRTGEHEQALEVAPKASGAGSSVSGGELLFLALATCYGNDYREAAKRNITVEHVEVTVTGEFGAAVEPARNVRDAVRVAAQAGEDGLQALLEHTDRVAEVHDTLDTLRSGTPVVLSSAEAAVVQR